MQFWYIVYPHYHTVLCGNNPVSNPVSESFHSRTTGKGDTASEAVKDKGKPFFYEALLNVNLFRVLRYHRWFSSCSVQWNFNIARKCCFLVSELVWTPLLWHILNKTVTEGLWWSFLFACSLSFLQLEEGTFGQWWRLEWYVLEDPRSDEHYGGKQVECYLSSYTLQGPARTPAVGSGVTRYHLDLSKPFYTTNVDINSLYDIRDSRLNILEEISLYTKH